MWEWITNNFATVVNIATAVFIFWQVKVAKEQFEESKKEYQWRNRKEGFEASFRLTEFYMSNVLPKSSAILFLFGKAGWNMALFRKIKNADVKVFDAEEATEILGSDNGKIVKDIQRVISGLDIDVLLEAISSARGVTISQAYAEYVVPVLSRLGSNDKGEMVDDKIIAIVRKELFVLIWGEIVSLMNELEYFSMYFNSALASDKGVYDSLHPTYIDVVCLCYPLLCSKNTRATSSRRYYTNVRDLYVRWRNREKEIEAKTKRNLESEIFFESLEKKL